MLFGSSVGPKIYKYVLQHFLYLKLFNKSFFIALVFFIAVASLAGLTFAAFLAIKGFFLFDFPGFCLLGFGFGGL